MSRLPLVLATLLGIALVTMMGALWVMFWLNRPAGLLPTVFLVASAGLILGTLAAGIALLKDILHA